MPFLADNCTKIYKNYVFLFLRNLLELCHVRVKLAPCGYTRVHCARKSGLKGHLPRANLIELRKLPTGLLLLATIRFRPQRLCKTMAEICFEMAETSGKIAEISSSLWDQHGLLTTTLKTENYFVHS